MTKTVLTPLTQALNEGALSRREMKALMVRSDQPALLRLLVWFAVMGMTGSLVWFSLGSWWMLPAMFVHGIVLVHHFSLQHECVHYTAFRTRWLNELLGYYCGLVIMLPNRFFRYEHCDHHTYTQVSGRDPEMIELPQTLSGYFLYLSSWPYWKAKVIELFSHACGRISQHEKRFIPKEEYQKVIWEARWMAIFYFCVFAVMLLFGWSAPLWFWFVPVVLGEPVMRAIRMTEHVGRPVNKQMKTNTRSNDVSLPWRFLCWNMNYHAEHHYVPSVPFHALPRLRSTLGDYVVIEPGGYLGAHKDIIGQLLGRRPRADQAPDQ